MQFEGDSQQVGQRLKDWRASKDWSGGEAAARVTELTGEAVDWPTLRAIEAGEALPEPWLADALAAVYERSIDELTGPPTAAELAAAASLDLPDPRDELLRRRSPHRPRTLSPDAVPWELAPGDRIRREDLHARFGGPKTPAISVSRDTPNVFLFTNPSDGRTRGHLDRWIEDDTVYLIAGEGQKGDQTCVRGNSAILNHVRDERALRLFEGTKGTVTYAGEFTLAEEPYELAQEHAAGGPLRQVIRFRLVRAD